MYLCMVWGFVIWGHFKILFSDRWAQIFDFTGPYTYATLKCNYNCATCFWLCSISPIKSSLIWCNGLHKWQAYICGVSITFVLEQCNITSLYSIHNCNGWVVTMFEVYRYYCIIVFYMPAGDSSMECKHNYTSH